MIAGNDERAIISKSSLIICSQVPAIQPETNSSRNFKQLVKQGLIFGEYKNISLLLNGKNSAAVASYRLDE